MQRLRKIFSISLCLIGFFVLIGNIVYAQQIPHFIKYQGDIKKQIESIEEEKEKGKDKDKDKDLYTLTFRIYNIETGGVALWEETHLKALVKKGKFEVILGSFTPLDLKFDEDYWLGIEIENKREIKSRERMTSVGYAYMSDDTWKLGGRLPDDYALMGHSHLGEDVVTPVAEAVNADMVDGLHADQIGGLRDHGLLEGLADDDHLQYLSNLRGDERYAGAGWDGLTKLKNAQDHIADKSNPHFVTLEQLGHIDNNPEEEAPTAAERGEPTGTEIQGWADDIAAWGHSNLVTNLNADKVDGKDSTEFSLIGHFHTIMDLSDVTSDLRAAFLAAGTAGASGTNRLATMTDVGAVSGLWTDEGTYIYPNNAGNSFQIDDTGKLLVNGNVGIGTGTFANMNSTMLQVGNFELESRVTVRTSDIAFNAELKNPQYPTNRAQPLLSILLKDTLQTGDANQIRLGFVANDDGGGSSDRRFFASIEAVVEDPNNTTRKAGLRFVTAPMGGVGKDEDERMRITGSGNIGIGTTNPMRRLHIRSPAGDSFPVLIESLDGLAVLEIHAGGSNEDAEIDLKNSFAGGETLWNINSGLNGGFSIRRLKLNKKDGEDDIISPIPFYIAPSGDVGISTINPQGALDVNSGTKKGIRINGDSGYQHLIFANSGNDKWTQYTNGDDLVFLEYNGYHTNRVIFKSGGNVGIGTTDPRGTLDVNGTIYQRGGLLHADYVFEPDYKLESIEEHSNFMWQEKHLKAVPRAAETEEGQEIVEVGARNRGILEELEKAHIYIAQLNERLKQLEVKLAGQTAVAR